MINKFIGMKWTTIRNGCFFIIIFIFSFFWVRSFLLLRVFISLCFLAFFRCEMRNNEQEPQDSFKHSNRFRSNDRFETTRRRKKQLVERREEKIITQNKRLTNKTLIFIRKLDFFFSRCALSFGM